MAWYPHAIRKPITVAKGRDRLTVWNRVNLHVAVSEASTLHHVFNVGGQVDSHFYVRRDGTVEQYVDTAWQAFADLDGNDATISVETQGMGGGGWTPEQRESLAQLYAWAVRTHGIARKMATSSKAGTESKGLSWHRLGCDGNFPSLPSILAGRNQRGGGMRYTKHFGKVCPGDGRVPQIPGIFGRAMAILDGGTDTTTTEEGFLMALSNEAQTELKQQVGSLVINLGQVEEVVRRLETAEADRRTLDLQHMGASSKRESDTLAKVDALTDQVAALAALVTGLATTLENGSCNA